MGAVWIFLFPLANLLLIWTAFTYGFKSQNLQNYPFFDWLISGYVVWIFLIDSVTQSVTSISEKSYLVKKMMFPIHLLPLVKILAALPVYFLFLAICFLRLFSQGLLTEFSIVSFIYSQICVLAFVAPLAWLLASLHVFLRDIGQIVQIVFQLHFGSLLFFWAPQMLPSQTSRSF